ncbi:polysaccharide deacetylase family protein [Mangrovibacillus sp. Mu-81]|uniref:polysaccharide deacetylase family protein n=1 Tax=Mangrovibacillus sp. Mu-81 TaxID=3121478 RepID=UPI002FE48129
MLKISIPNNFIPERKYAVDVVFNDFLGIPYEVEISKEVDYKITLDGNKTLVIKDGFFTKLNENDNYINEKYLPQVNFAHLQYIPEDDLPVLYGEPKVIKENEQKIVCHVDVFSSIFFMLTRWEEIFDEDLDKHGRVKAANSVSYKNNFLHRPVVNEYVEFLFNVLKSLNPAIGRKDKSYKLYLTHDIDHIEKWGSPKKAIVSSLSLILKKKQYQNGVVNLLDYFLTKLKVKKDPYNNFSWIMGLAEDIGEKSHFYFMSGGNTNFDTNYNIRTEKFKKIIHEIVKRKHIVGFHPSYNTFNDLETWSLELKRLKDSTSLSIDEGRQHYLRFSVKNTWAILEKNEMKVDSTLNYAEKEGFRCGTGDEYTLFDVINRKKLNLKERPLIFMDANHLPSYQPDIDTNLSIEKIESLISVSQKYNMDFTVLFHNSIFHNQVLNFTRIYKVILSKSKNTRSNGG